MELINSGMRKVIKTGAVVAQTAQFVSLMPKPQDFVTRVVGDVVYLSSQVKTLSDEMNKLLDGYAEIPGNYLMTQMNSIMGSLTGITNRLDTYTKNGINQIAGLGENVVQTISSLTGNVIDTTGSTVNAVVGLGSAIAESGSNIIGESNTSEEIHSGVEVILEWTGNGFNTLSDGVVKSLNVVTDKINSTKNNLNDTVTGITDNINSKIDFSQQFVSTLITSLRDKMKKLESLIDRGFNDVTGMTSVANEADKILQALNESDNMPKEAVALSSLSSNLSYVIKNFSIGKVVSAFVGVLTQSIIVRLALNELPPIDFESMLCKIRDDMEMSSEDLYEQYNKLNKELDDTYNDYIKFGEEAAKIPSEERNYNTKNYKDFIKTYEGELKEQRERIRNLMKYNSNDSKYDTITKQELRTAIKEIQKYRKQVKNAKQADTLRTIIGGELDNLKKEIEYRCNSIKSDWKSMMDQYKAAIKEIKEFFTSGGSCDMYIDDCCDQINKDCNDIRDLCKGLSSQLIGSTAKIALTADIGAVFPNLVYKIVDFWMDIKTILKFIKDLITLIIDIINNINKLARLFINGINNLKEIIKQLMDIIGITWLMDLIQSIIDMFGDSISNAKARLENSLSPVYFEDTDEYNNTIEAFDEILENQKVNKEHVEVLADVVSLMETINDKDIEKLIGKINKVSKMTTISDSKVDDIEELIDDLGKAGEQIVAYKSPILDENSSSATVSEIVNGDKNITYDIKLIGWHYFHPNLDHTKNTYYNTGFIIDKLIKKIKSKIIKRAAKTGHKKNGGITKLKITNVGKKITKIDKAYVAFYWYTYYTEELEKECFDKSIEQGSMIIDSIVQTQNGSVVEITDVNGITRKVFVANNMVRSGDYVNVDGVRYRVK